MKSNRYSPAREMQSLDAQIMIAKAQFPDLVVTDNRIFNICFSDIPETEYEFEIDNNFPKTKPVIRSNGVEFPTTITTYWKSNYSITHILNCIYTGATARKSPMSPSVSRRNSRKNSRNNSRTNSKNTSEIVSRDITLEEDDINFGNDNNKEISKPASSSGKAQRKDEIEEEEEEEVVVVKKVESSDSDSDSDLESKDNKKNNNKKTTNNKPEEEKDTFESAVKKLNLLFHKRKLDIYRYIKEYKTLKRIEMGEIDEGED